MNVALVRDLSYEREGAGEVGRRLWMGWEKTTTSYSVLKSRNLHFDTVHIRHNVLDYLVSADYVVHQ